VEQKCVAVKGRMGKEKSRALGKPGDLFIIRMVFSR